MSSLGITAVVPVWNGRTLLERLMASLERQTCPATELLIVDNGSSDGAPEAAARRGARVVSMGSNAGFSVAVNRGIRESRTEWIAILNSDVELAPDYFEKLIAAAEAEGAWFATGKILSAAPGGTIDATFDLLCLGGCAWRAGNGRACASAFGSRRAIYSAPFTAAVFNADLFRRIGVLEESFESYLEDVEFGIRCALRGFAGTYEPEAIARHKGSATLGRWHPETVRRIARNQVLLVARHYARPLLFRCAWPILVAQILWGGVALRHGAGRAWLRGKWQGIRQFGPARRGREFPDQEVLVQVLAANERHIREIQGETGSDPYWNVYFLLTGARK